MGWRNLEMYAIPPQERDMFYQALQSAWAECEKAYSFGILASFVFCT